MSIDSPYRTAGCCDPTPLDPPKPKRIEKWVSGDGQLSAEVVHNSREITISINELSLVLSSDEFDAFTAALEDLRECMW